MELRTILAPLLRWWWLILLTAILAGASSYYAVRNEPDVFQTRATLMAGRPFDNPNPVSSQFYLGQQIAESYAAIARREPVRQSTMNALEIDYLPNYDVNVPAQTQLLEIVVTDTNPELAQAVANEIANQLILLSPGGQDNDQQERATFVDKQLSELAVQIEETQNEIALLQGQLGDMFSAREIAETQDQIAALQNKLNTLQTNYANFLVNSQKEVTNILSIVESATLPNLPIGPNKLLIILLSVTLGTVLAAGAAYALEYIDDSIKSEDDVRELTGLPVLALLEENGTNDAYPALIMKSPRSPISEAFRDMRTRVLFLSLNKPSGSFLITSANPNEGKSFTAANLAVVIAQAGYRTVLVDGDLRRPQQHEIFELSNKAGLSNMIMEANAPGQHTRSPAPSSLGDLLDSVIQETHQVGLGVLTSGTIPPNPSELIGSSRMIAVIAALREKFDYLVMDSSPCLAVTDSLLLSSLSDSVIMVCSAKQTRGKNLKKAVERLVEVDANVVGVVLNRVAKITIGHYSYYHSNSSMENEPVKDINDEGNQPKGAFRKRLLQFSASNGRDYSQKETDQP